MAKRKTTVMETMTPEERRERARLAAHTRWSKPRPPKVIPPKPPRKPPAGGRPRLDPTDTTKGVSISVPSALHRLILEDLQEAGLEGVPVSWWIRKAIQEKLERGKKL